MDDKTRVGETVVEAGIRNIATAGGEDVVNVRYYGLRDRFYVDVMHNGEYLSESADSLALAIDSMLSRIKGRDAVVGGKKKARTK